MRKHGLFIGGSLLVLLFGCGNTPVLAQSPHPRHEISISYGRVSHPEAVLDLAYSFLSIFAALGGKLEDKEKVGGNIWTFGYGRQVTNKLNLGIAFTTQTFGLRDKASQQLTESYRAWALMFRARLQYGRNPSFFPYSSLALGYGNVKEKIDGQADYPSGLAAQLALIGLHYGRTAGLFIELGYGWQGVLRLGARFRFD